MNHADHVNLLRPARLSAGGSWADLGAGTGAFTLALRELVGPQATIFAVDTERGSLRELAGAYSRRFGDSSGLRSIVADFTRSLDLGELDGVLMANSLHFHRDKKAVVTRVRELLKPGGVLLIVEYNVANGNPWVPFPIRFDEFKDLAFAVGYSEVRLLAVHPSSFLREFYSAAAGKPSLPDVSESGR